MEAKETLDALNGIDPSIIKEQIDRLEERKEKLIAYKLPKELKDKDLSLTRGEKKTLKEGGFDLESDFSNNEKYDDLVDAIINLRNIEDADSLRDADINILVERIMLRTYEPLVFEGKK